MIREVQIKLQAYNEYDSEYHSQSDFDRGCVSGFITGAKWADQNPLNPWHDIGKELPKVDKEFKYKVVLVTRQDNRVHFAFYSEVAGFSVNESFYGEFLIDDVKYWMEIPELPNED